MSIGNKLAKLAKDSGICADWYRELKVTNDINSLLDMYLRGIDFCLANDYPSNDFIRANFKGKMEAFGVHIDEHFTLKNQRKVVALGQCNGIIEVAGYHISEVFLKHESEVAITAGSNSFTMVDMFDNSKLSILAMGDAKICINRYGGTVTYNTLDKAIVKVIEKNKKTY